MNIQPLVSIIIPTYNRAHLIGETLDSVLAQTYQNWECIIVDDDSTDKTDEVVGAYVEKDSRFKYYHRPDEHLPGGNGARNYGFKMSTGEYVQWFDSDDLMLSQNLAFSVSIVIEKKADILFKKHEGSKLNKTVKDSYTSKLLTTDQFYINYLLGEFPVVTNDVFIKRCKINVKFDECLYKAQEFDFFSRLFQQKIVYFFSNEITHIQRETLDSISSKTSKGSYKHFKSLVDLSKKMINNYSNHPEIVNRGKRQGQKLYKSYLKRKKIKFILLNFRYFALVYDKGLLTFFSFFMYNLITDKGFDRIKN
jgi:glycosyltransferase involved in cell wall biosynthesis